MSLSVAIITKNEEANIRRTLESVKWADEIVVVDSGSTDRTCEIAREYGAKVFVEEWKGFAKQKNSALEKCTKEWILSLDADEEVTVELSMSIRNYLKADPSIRKIEAKELFLSDEESDVFYDLAYEAGWIENAQDVLSIRRRNLFLDKWVRHGGFYPDTKKRLFLKRVARFKDDPVHETLDHAGHAKTLNGDLIHHAYPTLSGYIEHMNRYSDLGAEMVVEKKTKVGFGVVNIVIRPLATFIYNYFFRLGFLDGKEGLLLHLYHSVYVSWKYAKAWELSRPKK